MPKVALHPRLLLAYSQVTDGNMDFRFGTPKEVRQHRQQFFATLKQNYRDAIEAAQIHFDRLLVLNSENGKMWRGMNVTGVDGFVTTEPSVIMMIRTADCVPLVLYDPAHHAMALLHAGWRGTVKGMATTGLARLVKEYQTDPRQVLVWLGPAARVCHLTFPEIPSEFEHELWQPYLKINFQSVAVDLIAYIKATLHQAGVKKSSMVDSHLCTVELPELFSHRRSQADGSPAGRLAVVAKLK